MEAAKVVDVIGLPVQDKCAFFTVPEEAWEPHLPLHKTCTIEWHKKNLEELTTNNTSDLYTKMFFENAVARKETWTSNPGWYEWWRLRAFEQRFQCVMYSQVQQLTECSRQHISSTPSKTTWLQDHTNHKGLALCLDATLGIKAHRWVPVNTHGTPMPAREGRG